MQFVKLCEISDFIIRNRVQNYIIQINDIFEEKNRLREKKNTVKKAIVNFFILEKH